MNLQSIGLKPWHIGFFIAALLACSVALAPATLLLPSRASGFSYVAGSGSIWNAKFDGAKVNGLDAGTLHWRIDPGSLLEGGVGVRTSFDGDDLDGDLAVTVAAGGVRRVQSRRLTLRGAPVVWSGLEGTTSIEGLDLRFNGKTCASAAGALSSDILERNGRLLGGAGPFLNGTAVCSQEEAWLPIEGNAGAERFRAVIVLRPEGALRWQADIIPASLARSTAYAAIGFQPVPDEPYLRQTKEIKWLP